MAPQLKLNSFQNSGFFNNRKFNQLISARAVSVCWPSARIYIICKTNRNVRIQSAAVDTANISTFTTKYKNCVIQHSLKIHFTVYLINTTLLLKGLLPTDSHDVEN